MTDPNVDTLLRSPGQWRSEIAELRRIILSCGLDETLKWRQPCYMFQGENLIILGSFKDDCVISFLKGSLLSDPDSLLQKAGEHTQHGRVLRFISVDEILGMEPVIRTFILEAKDHVKAGRKTEQLDIATSIPFPDELMAILETDPPFNQAFLALTPGRQRAFLMYFTATKSSDTRITRILRFRPRIMAGKGMNDCICGRTRKKPGCDGSHRELGPDWVKPFA
jgi:uncharacterized protein YdeI (YjbR/CyaY-like superfamily)